jgi:maleylacetoacetate isomerase
MITLYTYWRSSAAYRVRIGLHWKQLGFESRPVNLVTGEQNAPAYKAINPQGLVPFLIDGEGDNQVRLSQSLAILEYLEDRYPSPPLMPRDNIERARIRQITEIIACDIHPINNVRILKYLKGPLGQGDEAINTWYRHWIAEGFAALEALAEPGPYFFGDAISLADVCLVPQMANARRYETDLSPFPKLVAIDAACRALKAFADAAPEVQPDAA